MLPVCYEHGLVFGVGWANLLKGWAISRQGDLGEGAALMEDGLNTWTNTGMLANLPHWQAHLAECYGQLGNPEAG
jgi:hypothetical protein